VNWGNHFVGDQVRVGGPQVAHDSDGSVVHRLGVTGHDHQTVDLRLLGRDQRGRFAAHAVADQEHLNDRLTEQTDGGDPVRDILGRPLPDATLTRR
jgi:hypothetical protein